MNISSKQATLLVQENKEIIQEKQALAQTMGQGNMLAKNLLKCQIKNRETIIRSLETFIKA